MHVDHLEEKILFDKLTGKLPIYDLPGKPIKQEKPSPVENTHTPKSEDEIVNQYLAELTQRIAAMEANRVNEAFRPIYSCRKYIGKLIVFCKRVVQKCLKWYVEPVCFQQTNFNNAATPAIGRLTELQNILWNEIKAGKTAQEGTTAQLNHLQANIESITVDQKGFAEQMENIDSAIEGSKAMQQATVKRLEQVEEISQQCELKNQEQEQKIGVLTVEHNSRLDVLEARFAEMEQQYAISCQALHWAQARLQELQEQGAFLESESNSHLIRRSTSQSGEDTILAYIFMVLGFKEEECSYLDLGANHAKQYSNTYYFYQKGARGVLVEANPKLIPQLKFYRNGDVILNRCVSGKGGQHVDFYILNGDGLSSPDKEQVEEVIAYNPTLKVEDVVAVETITVNEIFDTYFEGAPVFLNIDIEGEEMKILASIDFSQHRPLAISIETIPYRTHLVVGLKRQEIVTFMEEKGYVEYAFTGINSIFLDKRQIGEVLK